ncbi:MAG: cobalamin biosynthesis protein CobW, partial [Lachnospiraceae bacterium]|nr:cobalamin biosynthesis protein CobW [Lachnospiraceae bacterium]
EHHHHEHDEHCSCGCHDHEHHHHEHHEHHEHHHHEHDEHCSCGCHDHEHHHHEHHEHHEHHHHEHDEHCSCGCHDHEHGHHHHHHADEVFTSWGVETPHKYNKAELEEILEDLADTTIYGTVLRAKGMLPTPEGTWLYFDLTPGEYEIREGSPEYTGRLCVIGSELKEDMLKQAFHLA